MNENPTHASADACPDFREDIPLLAVGALDPDGATRLKQHLETCAGCRETMAQHRLVMDVVRRESTPSVMLDTTRLLQALRRRMAVESREAVAPAQAALSPGGRRWWLGSLIGLALAVCILLAVAYAPSTPPDGPGGQPKAKPVAWLLLPGSATEEPLLAEAEREVGGGGAGVRFPEGVLGRLREGTRARFPGGGIKLSAGQGVFVASGSKGDFTVAAGRGRVGVLKSQSARFAAVAGPVGSEEVTVAEGRVEFSGLAGKAVSVEAGFASRIGPDGAPTEPRPADARAAFAWALEQNYEGLACEFRAEGAEKGTPVMGSIVLRNAGERPVNVAAWHPLGVNYQLEVRRAGERTPEFFKAAPRRILSRLGETLVTLQAGQGDVALKPGESYELELDLRPLLKGPGPFVVAAHYLGFEKEGAAGVWGFTLRSEEARLEVKSGTEEKKTGP